MIPWVREVSYLSSVNLNRFTVCIYFPVILFSFDLLHLYYLLGDMYQITSYLFSLSGRPSFGPRSFAGPDYPVQFPLARPSYDNLQAICLHADHRPRYPVSYFPSSGFGQQKRRASAVNKAESWFSTCCQGNETWGREVTLCCATQAVSFTLYNNKMRICHLVCSHPNSVPLHW